MSDAAGSGASGSGASADVEADAAAPGSGIWDHDGNLSDEDAHDAAEVFEARQGADAGTLSGGSDGGTLSGGAGDDALAGGSGADALGGDAAAGSASGSAGGTTAGAGVGAGASTGGPATAARDTASAADPGPGTKPVTLDGPRGGAADDLKRIKGIGPKLEKLCHRLGFYHFDQIAAWTADEVAWVDQNLEGFRGRVTRDEWVRQAGLLASGGETEFSKRVDGGDVY